MAALTLAQLLAAPSEDAILQEVLSDLNQSGFPITDWESGGVMRTFVEMLKRAYLVFAASITPKIAGGGYLATADEDWIGLLAEQEYNLERIDATPTVQQATLTCDGANGPFTITVGQLTALTFAGRRYTNITGGTLGTSGTLILQWQSEGPNDSTVDASNYIDGAGTMTKLSTPLPGVTINNPQIDFTPVTKAGVTTALVTASRTDVGTSPVSGTLLIKIVTTGDSGVATFTYRRISNLATASDPDYVSGALVTSAAVAIPNMQTTVGFFNAAGVTNNFQAGDVFSISSPGGPTLIQGRDQESSAALAQRCQDRWPALSDIPTAGKLRLWAFAADTQVTKAGVQNDPVTPGRVNLTIGGQVNPLGGSVIATVQSYIDARSGEDSFVVVSTATNLNISIATVLGTVVSPPGATTAVKAKADAAWQTYIAGIDLGGVVKLTALQQILADAGAIDMSGLVIVNANEAPVGGGVQIVNLRLGVGQVAVLPNASFLPSSMLHWSEAKV